MSSPPLEDAERQIESLLDRIVEASSPSVVSAYEARIVKLEREKLVLAERAAKPVPPKGRLEDCIELALRFLSDPWNLYQNGNHVMRQTVLRLAFAKPLRYGQKRGVWNSRIFVPVSILSGTLRWKKRNGAAGEI